MGITACNGLTVSNFSKWFSETLQLIFLANVQIFRRLSLNTRWYFHRWWKYLFLTNEMFLSVYSFIATSHVDEYNEL